MSFPINTNIPNAPNDPADDQPLMKDNFNSINSLFSVNHFVPGAANNGRHQMVEMPVSSGIPGGLITGEGTIYTKTANGFAQVFYTPGITGNEYQLTRVISASFALFGANSAYGSPPAGFTQTGGWTFLPGGMLYQYGFYGKTGASGSSGTIAFPVTYTTGAFSVTIVANRADTSGGSGITVVNSTSTSGFTFVASTSGNNGFFWTAIGV